MANGPEKIFVVIGKYSNSMLSKGRNFGDDYSERYPFTKHIVASSPGDAIAKAKQEFKDRIEKHNKAVGEIKAKEEKTGRTVSRFEARFMGIQSGGPNIPCDIENWKAEELVIPGHSIVLEKIRKEST